MGQTAPVFLGFFYLLRQRGLPVGVSEWLALMAAVARGHDRASLSGFYHLARALVVKREAHYDLYDRSFAEWFHDVPPPAALEEELLEWLNDPVPPRELTDDERAQLARMDLDALRATFEERMREQRERHDGGSRFIGTGGTSPFGNGGENPQGMRVGGSGGGRSAVLLAADRRFANLRNDAKLDDRQIGLALLRLRRLAREEGELELDIDETVNRSARNAGEIDLALRPPRKNRVKLLLLIDVGGSMDPYAELCGRLFSAAHQANHFAAFRALFFHNCVYERLFTDIARWQGPSTADVLKQLDQTWTIIFVGDAWMAPHELLSGQSSYARSGADTAGIEWLKRFARKGKAVAWLNPEAPRVWNAPSIRMVRAVFPMFELTLDGLSAAVDHLRGRKPVVPSAAPIVDPAR